MGHHDYPTTPEQIEIVRWTASLGAITAESLALRLGSTSASARARLSVMHRRGLLAYDRPLVGRPALFSATRAGLRACDVRGISSCRVAAHSAHHLIVCSSVAAALERSYPDHRLIGERELRRDEREQGRSLASAQLGLPGEGESHLHRPDLVLWPGASDAESPVVVEVELTIKAPRRLVKICRAWGRCRAVAGVLYVAPAAVERALCRAISEARVAEKVLVLPVNALLAVQGDADTGSV